MDAQGPPTLHLYAGRIAYANDALRCVQREVMEDRLNDEIEAALNAVEALTADVEKSTIAAEGELKTIAGPFPSAPASISEKEAAARTQQLSNLLATLNEVQEALERQERKLASHPR